ncbi:MAG: segregation/condensation protein A [Clostridia bacterium]|nr:segregation/condensation protein A [Clostridia bacterium]
MQQPTIRLEVFEGPLDLLLSLIEKNKMDIHDIRISVICEQYMDYLAEAEAMDVELASEFIVMASELMLIKSRMLLPRAEEEEDPRAPLAEALLIYKQAKEAAALLLPMYAEFSGRMVKDEDELLPVKELPTGLDPEKLSRAFELMLSRMRQNANPEERLIKPLVRAKFVSVKTRAERIVTRLKTSGPASVVTLLSDARDRSELVAAFIALLELLKQKVLLLREEDPEGAEGDIGYTIRLELNPEVSAEQALADYEFDDNAIKENGERDANGRKESDDPA